MSQLPGSCFQEKDDFQIFTGTFRKPNETVPNQTPEYHVLFQNVFLPGNAIAAAAKLCQSSDLDVSRCIDRAEREIQPIDCYVEYQDVPEIYSELPGYPRIIEHRVR